MKRFLFLVFIISLFIFVVGCSDKSEEDTDLMEANNNDNDEVAEVTGPVELSEVGGAIETEYFRIGLSKVETGSVDPEKYDYEDKELTKFIAVNLNIKHIASYQANLQLGSFDRNLTLFDSDRTGYSIIEVSKQYTEDVLGPGHEKELRLIFHVHESDSYELHYEDPLSGDIVAWEIY